MSARSNRTWTSAVPYLPRHLSLSALENAAATCRGCPLHRNATQTVFGSGRTDARILLVGEQPGHEEDLKGAPFVGPAGRVLQEALDAAGIDPADTYVTNAVKHFKWVPSGKRRIHQKPNAREIAACLPWLDKEIELLKPEILVCLGATAAQALLRPDFKVTQERGVLVPSRLAPNAIATVHPSSILRQQSTKERELEMQRFTDDLRVVASLLQLPTVSLSNPARSPRLLRRQPPSARA